MKKLIYILTWSAVCFLGCGGKETRNDFKCACSKEVELNSCDKIVVCGGTECKCRYEYPPSFVGAGITCYRWINESDHQIKLSCQSVFDGDLSFENETIQLGTFFEVKIEDEYSSVIPRVALYKITVVFDDDLSVVYGSTGSYTSVREPDVIYDNPFNPTWDENYVWKVLKKGEEPAYSWAVRWTYTFTNADYEAARAISEAQGE